MLSDMTYERSIMKGKFCTYLNLIFNSFFRWWWAVITGIASIGSWVYAPESGILVTPMFFGIYILIISITSFLSVSVIYQGWKIYKKKHNSIKIVGFRKCDAYDSEFVFVLEGFNGDNQNVLLELKRFHEGIEVPISLVEVLEKNSKGQHQARPIWISSGHLRELKMGEFVYSDLKVDTNISLRTVENAQEELLKMR